MINRIHIQTIDDCNSKCIMCPSKSIEHSKRQIDDCFFQNIIVQIKQNISLKYITPEPEFFLFFNNEPLLDKNIYNRAGYIKSEIPGSRIIIFTNALLLNYFLDDLIQSEIDEVYISLYGYDSISFRKVTGIKITERDFNDILKAVDKLKKHKKVTVSGSWEQYNGKHKFKSYSSRAGYYGPKILHSKITGCSHERNVNWLNILDTGEIILCCMDWRKETVYGNLKENLLKDILTSAQSRDLVDKTFGIKESPTDFICKRCEWALTEVSARNTRKTLIITASDDKKSEYLLDFIISLRVKQEYNNEIVVFDFGLKEPLISILEYYKVRVLKADQNDEYIVNRRLTVTLDLIRHDYENYLISLFDCDIWFNAKTSDLFNEINNTEGCYFATEHRPGFYTFGKGRGPSDDYSEKKNLKKMTEVVEKFEGHINAGLMGGGYSSFKNKLNKINGYSRMGYNFKVWGMDQYLYNILYDFDKDRADGKKWNCVLNDMELINGNYIIKNIDGIISHGEEVSGLHCYGVVNKNDQKIYRFNYLNRDIKNSELKKIFKSKLSLLQKYYTHKLSKRDENFAA